MKRSILTLSLLLWIGSFFLIGCADVNKEPDPTYTVDVRLEAQVLDKLTGSLPQQGVQVYLHSQKYDRASYSFPEHSKFKWLLSTNQDGWVYSGWVGYNLRKPGDYVHLSASLDDYNLIVNNNDNRYQDVTISYEQVKKLAGEGTHAKVTRSVFLYLE